MAILSHEKVVVVAPGALSEYLSRCTCDSQTAEPLLSLNTRPAKTFGEWRQYLPTGEGTGRTAAGTVTGQQGGRLKVGTKLKIASRVF